MVEPRTKQSGTRQSPANHSLIDRRRDPRTETDLSLFAWGVETQGERFLQEVHARNISLNGALLSGFDASLHCGDILGILCLGVEARFRVVWLRWDDQGRKMQAAVRLLESDGCPWQHLLQSPQQTQAAGAN